MDIRSKEGKILRATKEKRTGSEGILARHSGRVFRRPVFSMGSLVESEVLQCLRGVRPDIGAR
jgi:hypothetical protein